MSAYNVLYYPRFEPNATWLRSVLLFVDSVHRIIPEEAKHQDSERISRLREAITSKKSPDEPDRPDPAPVISPIPSDLWIEERAPDFLIMMRAFESIAREHARRPPQNPQHISFDHHFIHKAKVPGPVLNLLSHHKLINAHPWKEYNKLKKEGYLLIQKDAGGLILSYIADRIARRKGLDSMTDFKIGFAVNALEEAGVSSNPPRGFAEGSLLSSIVSCEIPAELRFLSTDEYVELRKRYSDIRVAFKALTRQLTFDNRLDRIDNIEALQPEIEATAQTFVSECEKYRRSRSSKKFKKWGPFAVGSLIGVVSGFFGPLFAAGGKVAQSALQVVDKSVNKAPIDPKRERVYQMLCGLQEDILRRSPVKQYLHLGGGRAV